MTAAFLISIGSVVLPFFLTATEPIILAERAKAFLGKSFRDAESLSRSSWPEDSLPRISERQFGPLTRTLLMSLQESNPNREKRIGVKSAILLLRRKSYRAAPVKRQRSDSSHFYVELVPLSLGMPYVQVSNALHFDYSGNTPLCVYDWPHESTPEALARNRKGVARFRKMLRQTHAGARAYAKRVGLKIEWRNPYATISKLAWLTQIPKELDFKSSHWPSQFHHTGPFHDGTGSIDIDFPWERLTGEPLIYASMGTVQNGLPHVFRAIVTAAAAQKDVQLVLSVGDQLDPKEIGPVPSNAILVKSAPQVELLKRASVCITHAGLNTVLETLAQGVPQLAIPISNDQPGVAARSADKKTGLSMPLKELTASRLSFLLDEVLRNYTYRDNARCFQKLIAGRNGLSAAADLLERAFGLTRKDE
jgi:zeaxanthin glucosyltransferase